MNTVLIPNQIRSETVKALLKVMMLLPSALLFSCVTTQSGKTSRDGVKVIKQVGQAESFWTGQSREYFVDQRSSLKDESIAKIYSSLAIGEWALGEKEARNLLRSKPGHVEATRALVYSLVLQKKYSLASFYLAKVETGSSSDLNLKGIIALGEDFSSSRFAKARERFVEASSLASDSFAPYLNLGFLDLELGNSLAAEEAFLAARNRCDGCLPALLGLGYAYGRNNKNDLAKETLEDLLKKQPTNPQGLLLLASVLYRDKKDESKRLAAQHLKNLLAQNVGSKELRRRAQALLRQMESESRLASNAEVPAGE